MNLVVIRENEEDLYAGIEHRQTADVMQSLKLITRPGSERIIRFAFDYAQRNGRSKVTAFAKDNIMKLSDGLFHDVFDEVAADYPAIEAEYWIVDIGAAKLADTPEAFDVVVLPNLYGDILSDVAAQIAGSVGMAGAANIGEGAAMIRTKGEAGSGNIVEAVRHMRNITNEIQRLSTLNHDQLMSASRDLRAPFT